MFKLCSKGREYALRALTYAASQSDCGRFQAKNVCEKTDIQILFTMKVLQALLQAGSTRAGWWIRTEAAGG